MENTKTPEQIEVEAKDAEYKIKYGVVAKVENFDKDGKKIVCYFKPTSRIVLGQALAELENNTLTACEYIFVDSVVKEISDADAFFNDNSIFLGITGVLQSLVRVKKSTYTSL